MDYRRVLQELYNQRAKLDRAIEELERLASGSNIDGGPKRRGRKSMAPPVSPAKPATSADPLFGRPADIELDFPENLVETTHGGASAEGRNCTTEMGTKAGNRHDLVEPESLTSRQWPDVEFDVVHSGIESLLIPTSVCLNCNGTAASDGIDATQAQAGGRVQFFK